MNEIILTIRDKTGIVQLNRPEKRNALSPALISALTQAFEQLANDANIRVIVLKSSGDIFSAGADLEHLKQLQNNTFDENVADSNHLKELYLSIYKTNKIVIAQVEGHAIAGGCGLLTVCDLVFAVPAAKLGYTEVRIGFLPALVACFLPARIGEARTRELLLSGDLIDAQTAVNYGLINFIAEPENIAREVEAYAEKLAGITSAESVARTKALLRHIQNGQLEENLEKAVLENAASRFSGDFKKGLNAFLNREKLNW